VQLSPLPKKQKSKKLRSTTLAPTTSLAKLTRSLKLKKFKRKTTRRSRTRPTHFLQVFQAQRLTKKKVKVTVRIKCLRKPKCSKSLINQLYLQEVI